MTHTVAFLTDLESIIILKSNHYSFVCRDYFLVLSRQYTFDALLSLIAEQECVASYC